MGLFSDLELKHSKDNKSLEIRYNKNIWVVIRKSTTYDILKDYASTVFIKTVSSFSTTVSPDAELVKIAHEINRVYTALKSQFYNNKRISKIGSATKEFKELLKAAKLIKEQEADVTKFIHAQIEGFAFTNSFPTVKSLHGMGALDRYLKFTHLDSDEVKLKEEEKKLYISKTDKETPVRENPRWLDIYNKMKDGEASYLEVKFIHDIQMLRSGRVSPEILEALEELKPKRKRKKKA